jgi:hypothetical protein
MDEASTATEPSPALVSAARAACIVAAWTAGGLPLLAVALSVIAIVQFRARWMPWWCRLSRAVPAHLATVADSVWLAVGITYWLVCLLLLTPFGFLMHRYPRTAGPVTTFLENVQANAWQLVVLVAAGVMLCR